MHTNVPRCGGMFMQDKPKLPYILSEADPRN